MRVNSDDHLLLRGVWTKDGMTFVQFSKSGKADRVTVRFGGGDSVATAKLIAALSQELAAGLEEDQKRELDRQYKEIFPDDPERPEGWGEEKRPMKALASTRTRPEGQGRGNGRQG